MQSILTVAWLPTGSRGDPETPRVGRPSTCSINLNLFAKVHMRNFCFCIPEMLRCACPSVCVSRGVCVCVRSGTVSECQIFTSGMQRLRAQGEPWLRVRPTTSVKFLFLFFSFSYFSCHSATPVPRVTQGSYGSTRLLNITYTYQAYICIFIF